MNQTCQKQSYQMNPESVEIPGLAMRASRIGLGTWEWRDGEIHRNASRSRIMQEIDLSLGRLRMLCSRLSAL